MNSSSPKQYTVSKPRKVFELWLFLCLLWLSVASPFLHTCGFGTADQGGVSISSGINCASCDWLTLTGSTQVDIQAQTSEPRVVEAHFAPAIQASPLQSSSLVASRGPPA